MIIRQQDLDCMLTVYIVQFYYKLFFMGCTKRDCRIPSISYLQSIKAKAIVCMIYSASFTSHQQANSAGYKDLLLGFVNLQTMILEGKIAKDYDYHGVASPWIQMKLLRILALFGADDQK